MDEKARVEITIYKRFLWQLNEDFSEPVNIVSHPEIFYYLFHSLPLSLSLSLILQMILTESNFN